MTRSFKAFLFGACALFAFSAGAQAQSPKIWRHGMVEAKSDAGFVMMAGKAGFAQKQGFQIEYVQFKGDALALKAMLAGELESYEGSPGAPMTAASRGADIKLVGCYWPVLTYGLWTNKPNLTLADLKGKNFAISSPGALPDLFARAVLEKQKLTADDVKFVALGSDADRFRAVSAGIVDVAAASTEFTPNAQQMGLRLMVHAAEATPNYLRFCTYMSSKTLAQRGDEAVKFLAANMQALRHALANKDETVKLAMEMTEAKPDDARAAFVFDEVAKYKAVDPAMPIPMDKLGWMMELFVRTENLAKPMDLSKFVDAGPREKALALANK
jgi:NitT/TauT family transport system substrate-binding protein